MVQRFLQSEVFELIAQYLQAEKGRELFIPAQHGASAAGAEDVVSVLDLLQHALQFAPQSFVDPEAKDLRDFVWCEAQQSDVTGTLEELMDGEVSPEDQISGIFHLLHRVVASQVDRLAVSVGEFWTHQPGPVVQALTNAVCTEAIGGGLQSLGISDAEEGIIVLAEGDIAAEQFPFDIVMAVQVVGDLERQERTHAQRKGTQHLVPDIEVIVSIAAALAGDDAVIGVFDWEPRHRGSEGGPYLHALQNEINAKEILPFHPLQVRADIVLLAHALFGPFHGDLTFSGEGFHPAVILVGPFSQHFLGDGAGVVDIAEEINEVLRPGQQREVSENDEAVETVVYKSQQAAKQIGRASCREKCRSRRAT